MTNVPGGDPDSAPMGQRPALRRSGGDRQTSRAVPPIEKLVRGFHILCHHFEFQTMCHCDDGSRNFHSTGVGENFPNERAIDLESIDWKAFEVGERAIACPESSMENLDAYRFQFLIESAN